MSEESLYCSHLENPVKRPNLTNEVIDFNQNDEEIYKTKTKECIRDIQEIFNKGYTPENGVALVTYIQKQRSLLAEIMLRKFMEKPDPKMGDAMNTLFAQMEKSVRDDRKEVLQGKQLETSRETFELFSKGLAAVIDGTLNIPDFGAKAFTLDPMKPLMSENESKIKQGELVTGRQIIDIKPIEEQLASMADYEEGEEIE